MVGPLLKKMVVFMSDKKFQRKLEKIKQRGERCKQEYELKAAYAQYMPEKKTRKVSNVMLITIVVAIIGYFIADLWLQCHMGMEISSTLTTCWFSFWGVEIVALAAIKTSKVKNNTNETLCEPMYKE